MSILWDALLLRHKTFITLAKPIKIEGINFYIRDTTLLSPANSKSLASLGNLYEGFSKKSISQEDISCMSKFLKRDKKGFEDYAIQDAKIPLVHALALAMEKVNFEIKKVGMPLTLSSFGRNYVLDK